MAIASKLISIGIIVLSMLVGLISFYVISDHTKEHKKKHIDEVTSQLINFVVFIWVAKILLDITLFVKDPMAVLAYPSTSGAFYLAIGFSAILLAYKSIRKKMDVRSFLETFLHVFLVASFVYEFIQLVWDNNPFAFGSIVLLAVLIGLYFFIRRHVTTYTLIFIVFTGWSTGILVLTLIQPFVTVFGYIMKPWFVGMFFVIGVAVMIFKHRKRDV